MSKTVSRSLRVCMVTTFYPPYHFGGDAMFVYRLSNGLARRGHHVEVIHCRDAYYSLNSAEPSEPFSNHPNVKVHSLKSRAGLLSPLLTQQTGYPLFKGKKIKRIIEQGKFDVMHFHNISLIGGPKILEYGDAIKLYTLHEYWLVCPTHVLFKFNREACEQPSCLKCCLAYRRPPQPWRYTGMLESSLQHVDAFICPSRFVAEAHKRRGLKIPTAYLPLFVPKPTECAREADQSTSCRQPERPYFLFVGRLEKLKGLQDVIPTFKSYAETDLLIAGEGTYRQELMKLAEGSQNIRFLGSLPYRELVTLYKSALAVIIPSLCYETFGQTVVEAFSMKTPVIVKDTGALHELVADNGGGILYRDSADLMGAIDLLRTDPELRNQYGESGYSAYCRYWTEDHYYKEYFKLIAKVADVKCKSEIATVAADAAMVSSGWKQ